MARLAIGVCNPPHPRSREGTSGYVMTGLTINRHHRHYKSWRLTGLYSFSGLLYTAGFAVRVVGAFHYDDLVIYIVSVCLCFAAPYVIRLSP